MRILFLSHAYPPHELGGWPQNCAEIVERLAERGHVTHVLTSQYGVSRCAPGEPGISRLLALQAGVERYRSRDWTFRRCRESYNRSVLEKTIGQFQPDIVFVWGLWNLTLLLPYWAEEAVGPRRVAYAVADYWPMAPDMHERYWRLPGRHRIVESAKRYVRPGILARLAREREEFRPAMQNVSCVSDYVRGRLADAGILPYGARVIYNGIDPGPFLRQSSQHRSDGGLGLVYFGGLSEEKGAHVAIRSLALLRERRPEVQCSLLVVGDGHPNYVAFLYQEVERLGLSDAVTFTGAVPRAQIPQAISGCSVFLFTSTYEEPIARTVMEAMAAGLAVVGTAVGGQGEMLEDNENALIVAPGDPVMLADRVLELYDDPQLYERLVTDGRETVLSRFTLDRMVDEMEEWLQSVVDEAEGCEAAT